MGKRNETSREKDADPATRCVELEKHLDEALELIVKRDDQLLAAERRIAELEELLENNGISVPESP